MKRLMLINDDLKTWRSLTQQWSKIAVKIKKLNIYEKSKQREHVREPCLKFLLSTSKGHEHLSYHQKFLMNSCSIWVLSALIIVRKLCYSSEDVEYISVTAD